jgi:hypothetical protein
MERGGTRYIGVKLRGEPLCVDERVHSTPPYAALRIALCRVYGTGFPPFEVIRQTV